MKISDLITILEQEKIDKGDIPVMLEDEELSADDIMSLFTSDGWIITIE